MENSVKVKIVICLVAFFILMSISLVQNNFYAKPTYKKWGALEWSDFNGISKPFTGYAAAIFSNIYLDYDSVTSSYVAFAAQNNQQSWKKDKEEDSDYLLNHEQYHFNIKEVFARKMNNFIKENPNHDLKFYKEKLATLKIQENEMQGQYDEESDHSVSVVNQRIWEYKIDSLLQQYSGQTNFVTDFYTGAKAYFPDKPELEKGIDSINGNSYRYFRLKKYDMELSMMSFQYLIPEFEDPEQSIKEYYELNKLETKSFKKINEGKNLKILVTIEDTTYNDFAKNLWLYSKDYFYKVTATYPSEYAKSFNYTKIIDNFIDSFEVVNTDTYWREKFQNTKVGYQYRDLTKVRGEEDDCLVYSEENQFVFFRGPIFMENGSFIMIQDIPDKKNREVKYNFVKLNNETFRYNQIDTTDHILYIPHEKIPDSKFYLEFGYVPNEDMINECYEFNYQTIAIDPQMDYNYDL